MVTSIASGESSLAWLTPAGLALARVGWLPLLGAIACAQPAAGPKPAPLAPPSSTATSGTVPAPLQEFALQPADLDPAADQFLDAELAFRRKDPPEASKEPRGANAGPSGDPGLVVYLVGARSRPERARTMLEQIAGMGIRVVAPMYDNQYDVATLCAPATEPDDDCHGKLRLEAFEGIDHSRHIEVSRPNSTEARVTRMLEHLAATDPAGGWDRFLEGHLPRWSAIIIAGQSHGATCSAVIGKVRQVARVVMLSGPFDNRAGVPAPWTARPSLTPIDRFYGFSHALEEQHPGHLKDWQALGLGKLGVVVDVEKLPPPYAFSHQLATSHPTEAKTNPHSTTSAGRTSPRTPDGRFRYAPVWKYLFGL
jgi:hypothetical protein